MLQYNMNGAWGEEPNKKLVKELQKLGITLDVSRRPDNLVNINLIIDDEKIMSGLSKTTTSHKKTPVKTATNKKSITKTTK